MLTWKSGRSFIDNICATQFLDFTPWPLEKKCLFLFLATLHNMEKEWYLLFTASCNTRGQNVCWTIRLKVLGTWYSGSTTPRNSFGWLWGSRDRIAGSNRSHTRRRSGQRCGPPCWLSSSCRLRYGIIQSYNLAGWSVVFHGDDIIPWSSWLLVPRMTGPLVEQFYPSTVIRVRQDWWCNTPIFKIFCKYSRDK